MSELYSTLAMRGGEQVSLFPAPRYSLRYMAGSGFWGVWDATEGSWHEGDYASAHYAAGIPCWRRERDARAVLEAIATA
jgi:hypothetical protein